MQCFLWADSCVMANSNGLAAGRLIADRGSDSGGTKSSGDMAADSRRTMSPRALGCVRF